MVSTIPRPQKSKSPGFLQGLTAHWSRAALVSMLQTMELGKLTLTMGDGEQLVFGSEDSTICAKIDIHDSDFFQRCLLYADLGLAESYMDGSWDTDDIRAVISWFLLNVENSAVLNESAKRSLWLNLLGFINVLSHRARKNSRQTSKRNIRDHYDLGNDFFKVFLDPTMTYSSALFTPGALTLTEAQLLKYERMCRKLSLSASDQVLEIGCGWGGFSIYAAQNYGCRIKAITLSDEQLAYVRRKVRDHGLEEKIDVVLQDYRDVNDLFDKIVSIEMIEAVGEEYLDIFFAKCDSMLRRGGLLGVQMITCPDSRYAVLKDNVDFIQKHIFPGSLLPSLRRINQALEGSELFLYDLHDMGASYVKTLELWQQSFNENVEQIRKLGFDQEFERKWNYYFSYCQAAFDMRNITVVQAVYTRPNNLSLSKVR